MTKYLIYIFFLVFNLNLFAQNENFLVVNVSSNRLFRNYPMKIKFGEYQVIPSPDFIIEKINDDGEYHIIVTTQSKQVLVETGILYSGEDPKDRNNYYSIQSYYYIVTNMTFDLSLGEVMTGGILKSNSFDININPSSPLELFFNIPTSNYQWELSIDSGKTIKGSGKSLSSEAIDSIKKAKKGAKIKLRVAFDTDTKNGLNVEGEFIK
jgi:hypothetical protein